MVQIRRSKKFGPMRFTLSNRGIGTSVGSRWFRVGVGATGQVRRTVRIPGTGVYDTKVVGRSRRTRGSWTDRHSFLTLVLFGLFVWFTIDNWKGVLSLMAVGVVLWAGVKTIKETVTEKRSAKTQDAPATTDGDEQSP